MGAPMGPDRMVPRGSHAAREKAAAELGQDAVKFAEEVAEAAKVAGAGAPVVFFEGAEAKQHVSERVLVVTVRKNVLYCRL
jgi:hypothetical protein